MFAAEVGRDELGVRAWLPGSDTGLPRLVTDDPFLDSKPLFLALCPSPGDRLEGEPLVLPSPFSLLKLPLCDPPPSPGEAAEDCFRIPLL